MSELIEREKDRLPEVQSCNSGILRNDDECDEEKDDIIVYNDMLLILVPINRNRVYGSSQVFWALDYYQYRTAKIRDNRMNPIDIGTKYTIDIPNKTVSTTSSFDETTLTKQKLYEHYLINLVKVEDKSETNLHKIHYELLRKRVLRKLLNMPSKQEIVECELQHRNNIHKEIDRKIKDIPKLLYAYADQGSTNIPIKFNYITEAVITSRGMLPRFDKCPCADGKMREKFVDYVYYLFEELYHKHIDEGDDPHMWIGARIIEQLRVIYPHLNMICVPLSDSIVPGIVIDLNIDTSVNILTQ
jgi:hypothetical protein